jgi:dienelactone hydrolase
MKMGMHGVLCVAALGLTMACAAQAESGSVTVPVHAESVAFAVRDGVTLSAKLYRPPQGVAAQAAVVALHGCGGPYPTRDAQWAERLTQLGHTVLFPDSFAARGLPRQCRVRQRMHGYMAMRRGDAIAAAQWLMQQVGVPAGGVVLLGWSNGASVVLNVSRPAADVPEGLVRGMVAFYPGCQAPARKVNAAPIAPMLLMIGASDDWTPAAPCRDFAARAGKSVTLVVYPNAYHDFDLDRPVKTLTHIAFSQNADETVKVGGNPDARADALTRVPAFILGLPPAGMAH